MELKDSGTRREFSSGAVRDINEGKGRCDLLPLDVVGEVFKDDILSNLNGFIRTGDKMLLVEALKEFSEIRYGDLHTAMSLLMIWLSVCGKKLELNSKRNKEE